MATMPANNELIARYHKLGFAYLFSIASDGEVYHITGEIDGTTHAIWREGYDVGYTLSNGHSVYTNLAEMAAANAVSEPDRQRAAGYAREHRYWRERVLGNPSAIEAAIDTA